MLDEIVETLPKDFFRDLNGGIHAVEQAKPHPKAVGDDLYILGEYYNSRQMGRSIIIYYGSFIRIYGNRSHEFIRNRLRKNVLHEFRHHLESMAGERDLEVEDQIYMEKYKNKHRDKQT